MLPIRRDLRFKLPAERISDWNAGGHHVSQFFNTLSIFFPSGERFFIDSVRNYRERITDPELQKAVTAFIGQEAMHGREHIEYNDALVASGAPADAMERLVISLLNFAKKTLPRPEQLAVTIALEHFTAILADILLREPKLLEGAEPRFAALWRWHALEETEHKAVAYDVYQAVIGKGPGAYVRRCIALAALTVIFWSLVIPFHLIIMIKDGGLLDLKGWWNLVKFHWLKPGALRRIIPAYFDWYKPGFHPWQHDNRRYLAEIDRIAETYRVAA
ncbi:MAG: metal-dependent hydrolase [Nevskia sp.]|nr:metal-dependent hydrolase [Nevskia sp.]